MDPRLPRPTKDLSRLGRLFDTQAAAKALTLHPVTLRHWRVRGEGPRFIRLGRRVVYAERDLLNFLAERSSGSTGEEAAGR